MKKNKGMKIYKQRKKGRSNLNQIVSILGTSVVVLGAVIFGYYVVYLPVSTLVTDKKEENPIVETVTTYTETAETTSHKIFQELNVYDTTVTEVPVSEETTVSTTRVSETDSTAVTTTVSAAETKEKETTEITEEEEIIITEEVIKPVTEIKGGSYYLSVDDITDLNALVARMNELKNYTSVVLPLKVTGGKMYYNSSISSASLSGEVCSNISISEIVQIIKKCGIEPIAEISTIADNIYPQTYKKAAYQFDDGYTGEWLDNSAEKGGKPWMSPFSDVTIDYLSSIVDELTNAGIGNIICTDTYFPPFREKDLGYIGAIVQSKTRYKGLTNLICTLNSEAESNGGRALAGVNALDVINSSAEVFKPEELEGITAVITINPDDFSENAGEVMKRVEERAGGMKLVPCIISENLSYTELESAVESFKNAGYDFYIVK